MTDLAFDPDARPEVRTWTAGDGYPIHVATWPTAGPPRGRAVILHGVQSHGGWYHRLGQFLAGHGYEAVFPDRRGSGANRADRGHAPSAGRLVDDVCRFLDSTRSADPAGSKVPQALVGISWGGKLAMAAASKRPALVDAVAFLCPGFEPKVGVTARERRAIAWAYFTARRRTFPIPLSDPALFTDDPDAQTFIRNDPLGLRVGTAGLLAASVFLDRAVRKAPKKVHHPCLLVLAGQDRIIDNGRTRAYFDRIASRQKQVIDFPQGHHTLEFDPDPSAYARALVGWLDATLLSSSPPDRRPG